MNQTSFLVTLSGTRVPTVTLYLIGGQPTAKLVKGATVIDLWGGGLSVPWPYSRFALLLRREAR